MNVKNIFGLFVRLVVSAAFAGIFYVGWMAVAIPIVKSGPLAAKALCWLLAPVVTGGGFALGITIFELVPGTRKSKVRDIVLWPLSGCAIGAVVVFFFGPMLIIFGMFALGATSILVKELVNIKNQQITHSINWGSK